MTVTYDWFPAGGSTGRVFGEGASDGLGVARLTAGIAVEEGEKLGRCVAG
jgi:hypothetical protein